MQPQVAQSAPQDCPRCPKETPKVPQRETKGAQCGPQSMPGHFKVSSKEAYIHQNSRSTAAAAIIHNLGDQVKRNTFLKMAPQAKSLCSQDLYRNSEQNPGLHFQISLTTTPKPYEKLHIVPQPECRPEFPDDGDGGKDGGVPTTLHSW